MKIRFDDDKQGKRRYEICIQSMIAANPQFGGKAVKVDEWPEVISVLKALKSIGHEAEQSVAGKKLYDLNDGGGEIELERSEQRLLLDFLQQPMWLPSVLEEVVETIEWLKSIGKAAKLALSNA